MALVSVCVYPRVCVCPAETMRGSTAPSHGWWVLCLQPGLSKSPDSPGVRPHSNNPLLVNPLGT